MRYGFVHTIAAAGFSTVLAFLPQACQVSPPESSISEVKGKAPKSWSFTQQAKAGVDSRWIARFKDSRLNHLVEEALERNQDIRIASERLYRAEQTARVSNASSRPQLSVNTDGTRQENIFTGLPFGGSLISNSFGVGTSINWEPDIWGSARARKSASLAQWQAGGQDYRAARASLAAQVCKVWFALAEASQQVALAQSALTIRKKTAVAVRERFESDLSEQGGSAAQLRLAQVDVASAKSDLSSRQGDLDSVRRQLELLIGRYPAGKISGRTRLARTPSRPPSGLPSELLLRRPDILAAERRYAATVKRVKEAKLSVFPSFSLTASAGTRTGALSDILSSDFGVWSIGSNLAQPILTGGRVQGEIRIRKSNQREALAQLHKTVLVAFGEVEQALSSERWLRRREAEMAESLKLVKNASRAAAADFQEGNEDLLTLFTVQTRRIQIESQYLSLRRLRLSNRVDLHLALGGGFSVAP